MKRTQEQRILEVLQQAEGHWISSAQFIRGMWISQTAARICGLKAKGHVIQHSDDFGIPRDEHNYASYRLVIEPKQQPLI